MTMTVHGMRPALDGARAGAAVAGNERRRGARQQQRLVADVARRVALGVHPVGTGQPPAVAARQRDRLMAGSLQALATAAMTSGVLPVPPAVKLPTQITGSRER